MMAAPDLDQIGRKQGVKRKIGDLLIEHTSLTEEQLQEALGIQKDSGMPVGEILLKKIISTPMILPRFFACRLALPT